MIFRQAKSIGLVVRLGTERRAISVGILESRANPVRLRLRAKKKLRQRRTSVGCHHDKVAIFSLFAGVHNLSARSPPAGINEFR